MSDTATETFAYAMEISDTVARAVGAIGSRLEVLSSPGEGLESVTLSRGGLLVPGQSRWANRNRARNDSSEETSSLDSSLATQDPQGLPSRRYNPDLTVVHHLVGGSGAARSGSYIFDLAGNDIPWPGVFVGEREIIEDARYDVTTYFMLGAEVLANPARLEFVHGLCERFRQATERRVQAAIAAQG